MTLTIMTPIQLRRIMAIISEWANLFSKKNYITYTLLQNVGMELDVLVKLLPKLIMVSVVLE